MKKIKLSKSLLVKLLVVAVIAVATLLAYWYDYERAQEYSIELCYISDETPIASNKERVTFTVRVTDGDGNPCANHEIEARCSKGMMVVMLTRTDKDGFATFVYAPYTDNGKPHNKAGKVTFELLDLSNSVLIEVNTKAYFSIVLDKPEGV